jgi:pimeloyl-ACP methyl ester carboxylesterase
VLCVPPLGGWLLRRAGRLPAQARVLLTVTEVYCDVGLFHPQRLAEEVAELARRDGLGYAAEALLASVRAIVAEYLRRGPRSLWQEAALVAAPTLVIHGSHDRVVDPSTAGRAARTFRRARVVVLSRTGHVAQMEHPELVAREIVSLLAAAAAEPGWQPGQSIDAERDNSGGSASGGSAAAAVRPS